MRRTMPAQKLLASAVAAAVLFSCNTNAQEDEDEGYSFLLEEIIVTAQKKEQSILDIPFAISSFGEKEMKARGAADIKDMQYSIPGLSITSSLPGQDRVQIRGASSDAGLGLPTVGRYLDEVSVSSDSTQRTLDVPLLDIQRVEVLRGPQGTLYGAGSIGGTIRFITNSPDLNEVSGSVGVGYNSVDDGSDGHEVNGVMNLVMIEDKLAVRVAASSEDIAGWIDNTATGESDINEGGRDFVRAKVLFQPSDSFNASLMWMHYDFEQDNNNHELSEAGLDLLNVDNRGATSDRSVHTPFATPVSDEWDLVNLILNYETENANIISSTGYTERSINFVSESANAFFPPGMLGTFEIQDRDSEVFIQEIRMNSNWDKSFNYTVGAYYRKTDTSQTQIRSFPAVFGAPPSVTTGTAPVDSESWAVFGELSYDFSDSVTASFGLRYFEEDQKPSIFRLVGAESVELPLDDQSFDAVTPRVNILWRVADSASIYGTISKGFRSGGVNGPGSSEPAYEPEEAMLYEIGGRGEFLDGRVFVDGAIYFMDYDDVQVAFSEAGFARTTNIDSTSGPGVDLAVGVNITTDLTFNFTAGYVGREYDEVDTSGPANVAEGDAPQYTPKYTASASFAYGFDWSSSLKGTARLDLSHADGFSVFLRNFPLQPVIETEPLTYLNFRIGAVAEKWQVVLSADNLLNETDEVFPGGAFSLDTYSRPRTVSVKMDYDF